MMHDSIYPDTPGHKGTDTVSWGALRAMAGIPRYMKIDIEGCEQPFLAGISGDSLPEFVSVEAYAFEPLRQLHDLGYSRFKIVDQMAGFTLPATQREGRSIPYTDPGHSSGPFGLDVFTDGDWIEDFEEVRFAWVAASHHFGRTWFDCHAWMPR